MNINKAFDIYDEFRISTRIQEPSEIARCDDDDEGNERLLLEFDDGFTVELANKKYVEDSATLRCWRIGDERITEIENLEQLFQEFEKFKNSN